MKKYFGPIFALLILVTGCGTNPTVAEVESSSPTTAEMTETAPPGSTSTTGTGTSAPNPTAATTVDQAAGTRPSTTSTSKPIGEKTGSFASPVIGTPQVVEDATFCAIVPTGDDRLSATGFGKAARPATPISSTLPGQPACILSGANAGEISFAVTPIEDLQGDISPDGTWSLIDGNTSYLYCSEEEAGEPACALLIAVDEKNALTVFVFLPTNDIDNLGKTTVSVGELAMENLPDA